MNAVGLESNENGKKSSRLKGLIVFIVLTVFLLYARDVNGVAVNKYLFLIITAVAAFALPIEDVMCLIAFVMPLYVGLPGNYMTLIFLLRFLVDYKKLRMKTTAVMFCVLAGSYAFAQAFITNHTAIAELVFFPGMLLILFIFSLDVPVKKGELILSYATGVAVLGLIMLIHTLQICDFSDLLTSDNRLGPALEVLDKDMMLNVDPNFYGLFAIAAISCGIGFLNQRSYDRYEQMIKLLLIFILAACFAIALIGLSRTFIVVVIVWGLLYLLSVQKISPFFITLFVLIVAFALTAHFMPDVLTALGDRFSDSTMETGNGRTEAVSKFFELWGATPLTMFFGVGIFDCNVHCMPLQILFGGGIVFFIEFICYMFTLSQRDPLKKESNVLQRNLPLIVTIFMSCSVPSLTLLNMMYPIAFAGLCRNNDKKDEMSVKEE